MSKELRTDGVPGYARRPRSFQCKRLVAGLWLAVLGLALLNQFRDLHFAGAYSKQFLGAVVVGMAVWMHYNVGQKTIRELRAYRRLQRWREDAIRREQLRKSGR